MRNPFVYGSPISEPSYFYGRRNEIRTIAERLMSPAFESSSIIGIRRIGKTSLLHILQQPAIHKEFDLSDKLTFVYLDIAALGSAMTQGEFWHLIVKEMQSISPNGHLRYELGKTLEKEEIDFLDVDSLLELTNSRGLRTVLLLDEFENAVRSPNLDADFYGKLRSLVVAHKVALVTTSSRELAYYSLTKKIAASPFFNVFNNIYIIHFSIGEAHKLIEDYLEGTGVSFTQDDVEYVTRISGCHPYFLQLACSYLFDAYREKKGISRADREEAWQAVKENFRVQAEPHFAYYWKHSSENERSVLTTLAQRSQAHGLRAWMANRRYRTLSERYNLTSLVNQGIVVKSHDGHDIFSPSFAMWIASRKNDTMLPEPADPKDAEALAELAKIKANLDQKAQKDTKRSLCLYLGVLAAIWVGSVILLTRQLGWDKIEPWTHCIGVGVAFGSYIYFAITQKELSPKAIYDRIVESRKKKIYQAYSFDLEKYEKLTK